MIIKPANVSWSPEEVCEWLAKLFDGHSDRIDKDFILSNRIDGRKLMLCSADDLVAIGANKVGLQESILETIDTLRYQLHIANEDTLQNKIFDLGCKSEMLHSHLVHSRTMVKKVSHDDCTEVFTTSENQQQTKKKDMVLLDTLAYVSEVVESLQKVVMIISKSPFKDNAELRSMRSLILALGIELSSTAQRDQFVEKPNEILERSSKVLADYCDRMVLNTKDPLLVQALPT